MNVTVRALRGIGVDARGLAADTANNTAGVLRALPLPGRRTALSRVATQLRKIPLVLAAIEWADVVHWHFHWALWQAIDVRYAAARGKSRFVEFWGSDIRRPTIESADNPYYRSVVHTQEWRILESDAASLQKQRLFGSLGTEAIVPCVALEPYVDPSAFPRFHPVRQRLIVSDFEPRYPDPANACPLVIHSTTAPVAKGTQAVLSAVDELSSQRSFDFRLVRGLPHSEALALVEACDVFLDQFVGGTLSVAAIEAMAMGKPVVSFIKPSLRQRYPTELPIVVATQETLAAVLGDLIADGPTRHRLGREGRRYVEKYHDGVAIAHELLRIYRCQDR